MLVMVALVGVLLLVVVALCYRLWKLRQVGGTAAILRDYPAVGGHGWRHGVMRYRGGEAGFYRLSSLRWWPDRRWLAAQCHCPVCPRWARSIGWRWLGRRGR